MIRNSLKFLRDGLEGSETLDLMVDKSNKVNLSRHDLLLMNMLEGTVKIHDKKVPTNYYTPQLLEKLYPKKK